jgi:hypothetical protein
MADAEPKRSGNDRAMGKGVDVGDVSSSAKNDSELVSRGTAENEDDRLHSPGTFSSELTGSEDGFSSFFLFLLFFFSSFASLVFGDTRRGM